MSDRYVKSDENTKILYMDATSFYGHSMSQPLPYDETEMWHGHQDLYMNKLEEILYTPCDSDFGFFVEVDLRYPNHIQEKTKIFPFCPETKIFPKEKYNDLMKRTKPKTNMPVKKLLCDWTDKKNFWFNQEC